MVSLLGRVETPKPLSLEHPGKAEATERPAEVSTSEPWPAAALPDQWPSLPEPYLHVARHKLDGENLPSSTDSRN